MPKINADLHKKIKQKLKENPGFFKPKVMVYEKVYFVPENDKVYPQIKAKGHSEQVRFGGFLEENVHRWKIMPEPCKIDPVTGFYFYKIKRHLHQPLIFKFMSGTDDYHLSKIY